MTAMGSRIGLAGIAIVVLATATSRAQDSGGAAVDVQIGNRTTVEGTLDPPSERDTFWIEVPAGARLTVDARGSKKGPALALAMSGPTGAPLAAISTPVPRGARHVVEDAPEGVLRIDVAGDGLSAGDFRLGVRWELPRDVPFAGTAGAAPLAVPFTAETGTTVRVRLDAASAKAGARIDALAGPAGPVALRGGDRTASARLPVTGAYTLSIAAAAPVEASGHVFVAAPRKRARLDVTRKSRSVGNGRFLSRIVGTAGSCVEAPRLGEDQLVTVDVSGVAVDLPAGALTVPTAVSVGPAKEIVDPTGATSPAGVPVRIEAGKLALAADARITLPFDAGAFPDGLAGLVVVTRDDDGTVRVVPGPYEVDAAAGTVSFPAPHFSSYGAAQPALEMVVASRTNQPQAFAVGPDGTVYVLGYDTVSTFDPATGAVELFAGGGFSRQEGADRLDFFFVQTSGAEALADGSLLVCDGGFDTTIDGGSADYPGDVLRIAPDGTVHRFAGDGLSHVTVDGSHATATGLEWPQDIAVGPDGAVFVLVAPVFGPTSGQDPEEGLGKVLRIDPADGTIRRVAGGGDAYAGEGVPPLGVRLIIPGTLLVDSSGRVLVGTGFEVYRFDLAGGTTHVVAGAGIGSLSTPTVSGLGAPLRNVSFGRICGLSFDPSSQDLLYASDDFAGVVWRLDLVHDRAHIVAGRRIGFAESIRFVSVSGKPLARDSTLRAPGDALRIGDRLFVAETFGNQIRVLRPKR